MKKVLAIAAIGAVGIAAQADTLSYTNTFGSTLTEWSTTLNIPQFNPSFGTLNSISITLNSGMSSVLHITNNVATSSTGTEASELKVFVTNPGSYDLFGAGAGNPVIDNITGNFRYSLVGSIGWGTNSPALISSATLDSGAITDSSTLALFTGTGTEGLPAYTSTLIFGGHTGNHGRCLVP